MADKKISQLTAKGSAIAANDLIETSVYISPGVYSTRSVRGDELGGVSAFTELTDVPASYTGQTLKFVRVNAAETALEFATVSVSDTNIANTNLTLTSAGATRKLIFGGANASDIFAFRNATDTATLFAFNGIGILTLAQDGNTNQIAINGIVNHPVSGIAIGGTVDGENGVAIRGTAGLNGVAVGFGTNAAMSSVAVGYNVSLATSEAIGFGRNISSRGMSFGNTISNNNGGVAIGYGVTISGDGNQVNLSGYNVRDLANYLETRNRKTFGWGSFDTVSEPDFTYRSGGLNHLLLGYYSTDSEYSTATGTNWFAIKNGTAPAGQTDAFQVYANDITAGNSAPHFRTENGAIVKLYQETTGVTAATLVGNAGTNITDTDTFDGYTLKQVVKVLRNLGILA